MTTIRRAFTLVEMMITLTIIGMSVAIVLAGTGDNDRLRLIAATQILRSDIELAQVMTISHPADPVVLRFADTDVTYWLAFEHDPDTPITRVESGDPYIVAFGLGRASSAAGVGAVLEDMPDHTLAFNGQGGMIDPLSRPAIYLTRSESWVELRLDPVTGTVSETPGEGPLPGSEVTP